MAERLDFKQTMNKVMRLLQYRLRKRLQQQGHSLTGALENSLDYEVVYENENWIGRMFAADYGVFVEFGVSSKKIPYTPGRGRGGKSEYIQGLIRFWEARGLNQREAISAAFATANVHKREGMPTRASFSYTRTGTRTGFVTEVLEESDEDIRQLIRGDFEGVALEIITSATSTIVK